MDDVETILSNCKSVYIRSSFRSGFVVSFDHVLARDYSRKVVESMKLKIRKQLDLIINLICFFFYVIDE